MENTVCMLRPGQFLILFSLLFILSCQEEKLPLLGKATIVNGKEVIPTIPPFQFINQDSNIITNETFRGKVYVADFFFTSCPSICPAMTREMLRIHDHFQLEERLLLVSHSIDVKRDTVVRLKAYAENLGVESDRWHFLTGEKEAIYAIAENYFNIVVEDETAPGGYDHSGRFVLVDPNGYIRAWCNGTVTEEVDLFIKKIELLLHDIQ